MQDHPEEEQHRHHLEYYVEYSFQKYYLLLLLDVLVASQEIYSENKYFYAVVVRGHSHGIQECHNDPHQLEASVNGANTYHIMSYSFDGFLPLDRYVTDGGVDRAGVPVISLS